MVQTIEEMDIDVIHFHTEVNDGQLEISTRHTDAMTACDETYIIKYAIGKLHDLTISIVV